MKLYFAHPINIYSEPIENALILFIAHHLTGSDVSKIENPNQPHHQKGYNTYAERYQHEPLGKGTRGMRYFHEVVLPSCDGCVAFPFLDGRFGLGAADEPRWYLERNLSAWIIELTREATQQDLGQFINNPVDSNLFRIRHFTEKEVEMLYSEDPKLVVPHEETRLRTWIVYGQKKRPYAEAHLVKMPVPEGFYPNA